MKPVELHWNLETTATVERAWQVFSDTNRFNRAAGLNFEFQEIPTADGGVQRLGHLSRYGLSIDWEETLFDFRAPHHFRNVREFSAGPLGKLEVILDVEPLDSGKTGIAYTVRMFPSGFLGRPIVFADAHFSTKPTLDVALAASLAIAEGRVEHFGPVPPPMDADALVRLKQATEQILPTKLGQRIAQVVGSAPLAEQARIQALELGQALGIDEDTAIRGCLEAVRHGALELHWELLCPSCNGAKQSLETFDAQGREVHCGSCNIVYDGSFPDAIAAVFRTSSALRKTESKVDCVLSPQNTPHVLARQALEMGERICWDLTLDAGGYLLDSAPSKGAATIRVRPGCSVQEITADLTVRGLRPAVLEVGPGPVRVHLRNRRRETVEVNLKQRTQPKYTLTAGRLLEKPEIAALIPRQAIAPGVETVTARSSVIAVELRVGHNQLAELHTGLVNLGCRLSYTGNNTVITTWDDEATALSVAQELDGDARLAIGIAVGAVTEVRQGDQHFPVGGTLDRALATMRAVKTARVGIDEDSLDDELVYSAIEALGNEVAVGVVDDSGVVALRFRQGVERRRRQAEEAPSAVATEVIDGRYQVFGELGRGGMGQVFEVVDLTNSDNLVIKRILPAMATDSGNVQRFYNEARVSAGLHHPNIIDVRDWGTDEQGFPYIVMEKLVGEELEDRLRRDKRLDEDLVKRVGRAIAGALEEAHRAGIVHRDIKPENIFVHTDEAGREAIKLIDFGIAQSMDEEDELAKAGILCGSLHYVSPEQARLKQLDGRSDLYTLGLVMWTCVAGKKPFDGKDLLELVMARVNNPPPDVHEAAGRPIDAQLAEVIECATARDRDDRYPSAAAMKRALES